MRRYIVFFLVLISFYACNSISEKRADEILQSMEEKDGNYQDISSDTLIFEAQKYFTAKNNLPKAALASFYCGRVYQEQDQFDKAMEAYMEAETLAKKIEDDELLGTIYFFTGKMYYKQLFNTQCIEKLKLSLAITKKDSAHYSREIAIYTLLGSNYLIQNENDSCFIYYDKALQLANLYKDSVSLSIVNENLSVFYQEIGDLNTAKNYLQESIELNKDKSDRLYFNLAKLFDEANVKDSVIYYTKIALDLAEKENNNLLISTIYNFLSQAETEDGNYKKALDYKDRYTYYIATVLNEKRNNDILVVENKYNYVQTQNKNNQLLIERQYIFLSILGLGLFIIVIGFYAYWKINSQRIHLLNMEKTSLESEQQIRSLTSMAESYNVTEKSLRTAVLSHFDISKKIALLKEDGQLNDRSQYKKSPLERINDIIYGNRKKKYNWEVFFDSISTNTLYKDTIENINVHYPMLDSLERQICYLTCMDFSNSEISVLLECALNTIEQKKTNIRKKLNVPNRTNIKTYLATKYVNN
ncbi:hypothetical protein FACS189421_13250 [Bacteroidia bacterium]|nr:hypothetical protein FACS189421_13250 [Bacteroidia bacterium]GHT45998.1 hypothetical protein FACS189440_03080 [Bacteroidia bacterium]